MKRSLILILAIGLATGIAFFAVKNVRLSSEFGLELLGVQSSPQLEWSVFIYGVVNNVELKDPFIGAEHIRVVDRSGSRYCVFRPEDPSGYACTPKSIWSPDGRYLVLSDGQQEGFVVYRETELPGSMPGKPLFRAKVVWDGGYKPVHQFDGWMSDGVFGITTGAHGLTKQYRCDLNKLELVEQK